MNVLLEDGPGVAPQVVFRPRCVYPTLVIMCPIRAVLACEGLDVDRSLYDDPEETELEKCERNWRPAMSKIAGPVSERPDLDSAAALFVKHVLPMSRAHRTRSKLWTSRQGVWTWALSQGALGQILQVTEKALHAFLWDTLSSQCSLLMCSNSSWLPCMPAIVGSSWARLLVGTGTGRE